MSDKQIIFVLDLDGTIIGDCSYQCDIYNIDNISKKYNKDSLLNCYKPDSKLIRPYFKYFFTKIKKNYPNSLFYIYTASEKLWAHKEIGLIEKTHNIKFNRPLFSRQDCIVSSNGEYKKSINKILPKIKKNIKNIAEFNFKDNIIIIDNNNTFIDYNSNFINCKTYDYILFLDLWENINTEYKTNKDLYLYVLNLIYNNKLCKFSKINNKCCKQLELIHKWIYKKYKKNNKYNKKFLNDNFWKKITDQIVSNNFSKFNNDTIKYLRKTTI